MNANNRTGEGVEPLTEPNDLRTPEGLYSLGQVKGIGVRSVIKLAEQYATWSLMAAAPPGDLKHLVRSEDVIERLLLGYPPEVHIPSGEGVRCITYFDNDYPAGLRDLSDPPALVWIRGKLPSTGALAIVGTREPTSWGRTVTQRFAQGAVEAGWEVISGLALGIDSVAHEATLGAGGITHAVLAGGVDYPSPRKNVGLANSIVGAGGSLISEQPPGVQPKRYHFVKRDRLQAALSRAVIVTECGPDSGALHAAKQAVLLGRILAVPRPSERLSKGTQSLLAIPPETSLLPGPLNKSERSRLEQRERIADIELNADLPLGAQLALAIHPGCSGPVVTSA